MFADEETLREHIEQLRWYINRYGRGIVIYWHTHFDSIKESPYLQDTNGMIIILDDLPEKMIPTHTHQGKGAKWKNDVL